MKIKILLFMSILIGSLVSCGDYPIDENGLLITEKDKCYMSSFYLVGTDNQSVLVKDPTVSNGLIDTVACTVTAVAKFGTNLTKVKPYCSVTDDITVEPGMGKWIDFTTPKEYTLVSGNREIRKKYTITVTVQK
ncbi:hypothetical protein [Parabacteroides faecis]|uniref:hypothetical protein n=1 Tax=Parabacteroides faecis TaxID=1217282 RepID=UPI003520DEAC